VLMAAAFLPACTRAPASLPLDLEQSSPSLTPSPAAQTYTPQPASPEPTQAPSPTPGPTPTADVLRLCSPLQGVPLNELEEAVSSPFHPPPKGSDAPHHGVDLAHFGPDRIALGGLPVMAVMDGRIAGVITDRFPYGNALIVETPFEELPGQLLPHLPELDPFSEYQGPLTCPPPEDMGWYSGSLSLYLLYAHMQDSPDQQMGERVSCGDRLGRIGDSGNALNPHLHLEMRVGPSGARIPSLSHYHPSATLPEMSAYCTWRISGTFQMFDPMIMFSFFDY
jgi:murein DD-endopeptidase MepM/ murein hydrolase activator NlpD